MAASFRSGCSISHRSATSTCTLRFCPSIAALLPFNGRSRTAKLSPASPPCASTPASIPATSFFRKNSPSGTTIPQKPSRRFSLPSAPILLSTPFAACKLAPSNLTRKTIQKRLSPILKKEDGLIDFSRSASDIYNRIRGFQPWPGAYTKFRGKNLQILKAQPATIAISPAEVNVTVDRLRVGCGQNSSLELLEIQLEGKKRSSVRDFIHGYRPQPGERLGSN